MNVSEIWTVADRHLIEAIRSASGWVCDCPACDMMRAKMLADHPRSICRQCQKLNDADRCRYCSNACRQRAYRLRLKSKSLGDVKWSAQRDSGN